MCTGDVASIASSCSSLNFIYSFCAAKLGLQENADIQKKKKAHTQLFSRSLNGKEAMQVRLDSVFESCPRESLT